jgi:hypothetical protein
MEFGCSILAPGRRVDIEHDVRYQRQLQAS